MIVGTSTGGIIAGLAGIQAYRVPKCEELYDELISKIFIRHPGGGMKLALKQARQEGTWNLVLYGLL